MSDGYAGGVVIVGALAFLLSYVYSVLTYGFDFAFGLGWVTSIIVAVVDAFL